LVTDVIDLNAHILPDMDDGSPDMATSLEMARVAVDDGIVVMACTPLLMPGLYAYSSTEIAARVSRFQERLNEEDIPLDVVAGSCAHHRTDFLQALGTGHITPINNSRYVLFDAPHMVPPPRLQELMGRILDAGYVPVLAKPERLKWIEAHYELLETLVEAGVWLQVTAGSLTGHNGRQALYWAEKLLDTGMVHILATDTHNLVSRPPILSEAYEFARSAVGPDEALNLVSTRPVNILDDLPTDHSPAVAFSRSRTEEPKWLWPRLLRVV
jgi:protein-tyrosine phosphatase